MEKKSCTVFSRGSSWQLISPGGQHSDTAGCFKNDLKNKDCFVDGLNEENKSEPFLGEVRNGPCYSTDYIIFFDFM